MVVMFPPLAGIYSSWTGTPPSANRESASCRRSCQCKSIFASACRFDTRWPLPMRVGAMPFAMSSSVSLAARKLFT